MWSQTKILNHALENHQQAMVIYARQFMASGYSSTIAYNLYLKHYNEGVDIKTKLRNIKAKGYE